MSEDYLRQLGARIRLARVAAGFETQTRMAEALGIPQANLAKYEGEANRVSAIPHSLIPRFCAITGISEHWLLTGEGKGPIIRPLKGRTG